MKMILCFFCLLFALNCPAVTRYVSLDGGHDTAGKYTTWTGAATTIQAAINVSGAGDWIWVSNGTYEVGSSVYNGDNRVLINIAVTVASWNNDRTNTIIKGDVDVRPVSMVDGTKLFGFTITNGNMTANSGGGIRCNNTNAVISNCLVSGNTSTLGGGIHYGGYVVDCDIIGNSAQHGGGVNGGALVVASFVSNCNIIGNHATDYAGGVRLAYVYNSRIISNTAGLNGGGGYGVSTNVYMTNCIISGNSAVNGGGSFQYNLYNCRVLSNTAITSGGGAHSGILRDSQVVGNTAGTDGGGIFRSSLYNCEIIGNYATDTGGGVYMHGSDSITNCLIVGNQAGGQAGGVWGNTGARVDSCTISGNTAGSFGGVRHVTNYNTIVWGNQSGVGTESGSVVDYYSCGVGFTGVGSIINDPKFIDPGSGYGTNHVAGDYRLQKTSPCINAGTNLGWMAGAGDMDGHARIDRYSGRVDMGYYEYLSRGTFFHFQ